MENLKPLKLGGVLEKTFNLVFSNMKQYLILLGIFLPIALVIGGLINAGLWAVKYPALLVGLEEMVPYLGIYLMQMLDPANISFLTASFIIDLVFYGMLVDLSIGKFLNSSWTRKESFRTIRSLLGPIFLYEVLNYIIQYGGLLILVVGSTVLQTFLCLGLVSLIQERLGPAAAVKRSFSLVSKSFWTLFGYRLVFGVIFSIIFVYIPLAVQRVISFARASDLTILMVNLSVYLQVLRHFLETPFLAAFAVVLYFNQRVKFENFGVENLVDSYLAESEPGTAAEGEGI